MNESIKRLEEKVAFLEHHVTQQDKVMLELAEQLRALRREIHRLQERGAAPQTPDPNAAGDIPDDRPPHY